jgi:hypothetical protein
MSSPVELSFSKITLVAHADWSKNPVKRWVAVAILQSNHHWRLCAPIKVEDPGVLVSRLQSQQVIPGCLLAGFDFPIGLPFRFAQETGLADFLSVLPRFGHGQWQQFFSPAQHPSEISLTRPFYPDKPGNSSRATLEKGLGISFPQFYRLCEMRHNSRHAACPVFWTLGGQQVGKAAISGWRDLLIPALSCSNRRVKIWPFSGTLAECCHSGNLVIVETYPAEFYGHLGLSFSSPSRKSKRRQSDRQSFACHLLDYAASNRLEIDNSLKNSITNGFGSSPGGEDCFDAVIGLYGMINIILGHRPVYEPGLPTVRSMEGWIFGQAITE